jgi:signal transduction histidine kinase
MTTARYDDDPRRRAIREYDVLGRPPEPDLESLAGLAAHVCGVRYGVINLIDEDVQHSIATAGFDRPAAGAEQPMCAVTVLERRPVVLEDARADPRFASNPYVDGRLAAIRFYAASQLRTPDDVVVGTLCVFDDVPHRLLPAAARALDSLARQVIDVLELRRITRLMHDALAARDAALADARRVETELHRSNQALASFAAQVSHDLRNPLAAVVGFYELLADTRAVVRDAEAAKIVQLGHGAATRMQEMVEQLLVYARMGGGLQFCEVDLAEIAEDVVEDLRLVLETTKGRVDIGALPTLRVDPVQVRVLLQNLIANALTHAVRPGRPPTVWVEARAEDHTWRVSVCDDGPGIPEEHREAVFDVFHRVPGTVPSEGLGLGLATCYRIVRAHGGRIGVGNSTHGGAEVWFTLPRG